MSVRSLAIKASLEHFLAVRNFDKLPDNFYWVMFPYPGEQPPPFENSDHVDPTSPAGLGLFGLSSSKIGEGSPEAKRKKGSPESSLSNSLTLSLTSSDPTRLAPSGASPRSSDELRRLGLSTSPPGASAPTRLAPSGASSLGSKDPNHRGSDEPRWSWWFYPLIFIDDLPFSPETREHIAETTLVIGPLAKKSPDLAHIKIVNPGAVKQISYRYAYDGSDEPEPDVPNERPHSQKSKKGQSVPPLSEIASMEHFRVITEAKEKGKYLLKNYPEILENVLASLGSLEACGLEAPLAKEKLSKRVKNGFKKISPKMSRKTETSS